MRGLRCAPGDHRPAPVTLSLVDAPVYTYREIIVFLACLWGRFARESVAQETQRAVSAADAAEKSRDGAKDEADRSKAEADRAQAEAERVAVPPVEGVYNVILSDRATGERYALLVERGRLALLGVSDTLEATIPLLIDQTDGKAYAVVVEDGRLKIEETA